ncbi:hypothetical protein Bhyg_04592, partial [Pseudolycoriella hygida]
MAGKIPIFILLIVLVAIFTEVFSSPIDSVENVRVKRGTKIPGEICTPDFNPISSDIFKMAGKIPIFILLIVLVAIFTEVLSSPIDSVENVRVKRGTKRPGEICTPDFNPTSSAIFTEVLSSPINSVENVRVKRGTKIPGEICTPDFNPISSDIFKMAGKIPIFILLIVLVAIFTEVLSSPIDSVENVRVKRGTKRAGEICTPDINPGSSGECERHAICTLCLINCGEKFGKFTCG